VAERFDNAPELRQRVGLLPEVSDEVLDALGDELEHPVREHWEHLANEQPRLLRRLLVKANAAPTISIDPRQAFLMGAMYAHEAVHEQTARNLAEVLSLQNSLAIKEEPTESEVRPKRFRPFRLTRLGAALMVLSWRQKKPNEDY